MGLVATAPEPLSPERGASALQTQRLGGGSWGLARLSGSGAANASGEVEVARGKAGDGKGGR